MAITSGLFNSRNGDRRYDAVWFARYFATFIGNGVFPNPSTGLQVIENENMTTTVKAGDGWINGYFIVNDSDYILQHDLADGVLNRIDRIVMRLDYLSRQIEIVVKEGVFASNPVAPILQRDPDAYELALADVLIDNGATQITQANITDLRLNSELCGIVHGVVDQVDTTTIFNQFKAWLEEQKIVMDEWQSIEKAEFESWFNELQVILEGDVAANLANQIALIKSEIGTEVLPTQAQTLRGAIAEVFQSGNNRKETLVDLLLSLDDSLLISYSSTWDEIFNESANLSTGKKFAMGNETAVVQTLLDFSFFRGNNSTNSDSVEIITEFGFVPSVVLVISERVPTNNDSGYTTVAVKSPFGTVSNLVLTVRSNGTSSAASNLTLKLDGLQAYISSDGFRLPINRPSYLFSPNYTWIALE